LNILNYLLPSIVLSHVSMHYLVVWLQLANQIVIK